MKKTIAGCAALALTALSALAGPYTGTQQSSKLYTPPDPNASGGIRARILFPMKPIRGVYAISQVDITHVYAGTVANEREISFKGLPVGKYDLLVLYADAFYEGMALSQGDDSLTDADRASIEKIIAASVPFFDTKKVHRCIGQTGKEGKAQCVLQEVRTRPVTLQDASVRSDIQIRSLKIAAVEDVGSVGWQLGDTREIVRQEVGMQDTKGVLPHHESKCLRGIRVVDEVKDLGELKL